MRFRIFLTSFVMCLATLSVMAQKEAVVKSFTMTTDHIPSKDRRNDLNGKPCALVKVQVVDEIERVEGNKIGKIVKKGVEKWIYMCKGSRNMRIHFKNFLPVKVMFQDYQINGLESNRVYELVIETPDEKKTAMQTLILNYSPADATVLIDSKTYKGNGRIEVSLPVGEHNYTISALGYVSSEGIVKLTSQAPREITEKLAAEKTEEQHSTSIQTAKTNTVETTTPSSAVNVGVNGNLLTIKVSPFYAKINIDGKTYEADGDGELTVPVTYGVHSVEVAADGYSPMVSNINMKKSAVTKKIKLSELKEEKSKEGEIRIGEDNGIEVDKTGNIFILKIKYLEGMRITQDEQEVNLNGQDNVKTIVFTLPYGAHEFKVECAGYETEYFSVNIGKSKVTRSVKLKKNKKKSADISMVGQNSNGVIPGQNGNIFNVEIVPYWATIEIDGEKFRPDGEGFFSRALVYGIHKIIIEAEGYESKQFTVNIAKSAVDKKIKLKRSKDKK